MPRPSDARPELALVVLAAGASVRLGRCKATVEIGGRSALAQLCTAGAALGARPILIVSGAHDAEIRAAAPAGAEVLHNPDWSSGRSGGILRARDARLGLDLCIASVDTPLVPAAVFEALARAWIGAGSPPRGWLAPLHRASGRYGHPVVVGRELLGELEVDAPDRPLRALRDLADPLLALEIDALEVLDDLDEPADLERLRARAAAGPTPFRAEAGPIGGRCNPGEAAPSPVDGGR